MKKKDVAPKEWYVRTDGGECFGPVDLGALVQWAREGRLMATYAASADGATWLPLADFPELEMHCLAETAPGVYFGPVHREVIAELIRSGELSEMCPIYEKQTGAAAAQQAEIEALTARVKQAEEAAQAAHAKQAEGDAVAAGAQQAEIETLTARVQQAEEALSAAAVALEKEKKRTAQARKKARDAQAAAEQALAQAAEQVAGTEAAAEQTAAQTAAAQAAGFEAECAALREALLDAETTHDALRRTIADLEAELNALTLQSAGTVSAPVIVAAEVTAEVITETSAPVVLPMAVPVEEPPPRPQENPRARLEEQLRRELFRAGRMAREQPEAAAAPCPAPRGFSLFSFLRRK